MSIKKELRATGLPDEIQQLIRRVARRTRIRSKEQLDVARELMEHFADALEQGESPSDAIAAYGDEKTAAKLLRIASKRKRWWVEVAFVKSMKYAALGIGCFVLVYFVMVLFALQRKPTIAVDYVAKMNETAAAIPEDERAWPLYRAAGIAFNKNSEPTPEIDGRYVTPTWVGDAGWDAYAAWLELHDETLDLIRQGTMKAGVGYINGNRIAEEDKELWPEQYEKTKGNTDSSLSNMLFPQLGQMRSMARLLKYDAIAAAEGGDGSRCIQDVKSILRLGTHTREHSTVINDLVSMSIYSLAFQTLGLILERTPEILQFEEVRSMLSGMDGEFEVRFDSERMFILDLLQRTFTDDGNGDGRLVPGKLVEMMSIMSQTTTPDSTIFLAPLGDFFIASRKELLDHYDKHLAQMERYRNVPLYEWDNAVLDYAQKLETRIADSFLNKYYLLDLLLPVLDRAMLAGNYTRANRDGLLATLYAIETHRSTGQWPTDLSAADVVDPWTGEPWRFAFVDNQPTIYSIGTDRDDDGGKFHSRAKVWYSSGANIPDGDWVVWPNPE